MRSCIGAAHYACTASLKYISLQRGNALMVQRAVGDIGNDVSRFISLSNASGGGHLPDFFGAVAAGSA